MPRSVVINIASSVAADRNEVWQSVSTMAGVNFELHPFVHMTSPRGRQVLPSEVTPGQLLFRSWLLLFGLLPFDRHALALESLDDGRGFVEESKSWLQSRWLHARTLTALPTGNCLIEDRLVIEPRLGPTRPIVAVVVKLLFTHRHRRLVTRFGEGPALAGVDRC